MSSRRGALADVIRDSGFYAYCGCGWKCTHPDRKEAWRLLDEHWKRYFPAVGVGTVQSFRSRWVPIGTTWRDR